MIAFTLFLLLAVATGQADPLTVDLDVHRQHLAGIRIERVQQRSSTPQIPVPAYIVEHAPLIAASQELKALTAELAAQENILALLQQRLSRLEGVSQELRRETIEQARWDGLTAQARVETLAIEIAKRKAALLTEWGPLLSSWAETGSERLARLAQGEAYLLRLVLPPNFSPQAALIEHQGKTWPLEYLSPDPKVDSRFSGNPHYYYAAASGLPIGGRLLAWLTEDRPSVLVPHTAVVWHEGQPWVFVQSDPTHFAARPVFHAQENEAGFWLTDGLAPEEPIVVEGAALLLAEALRTRVPDENDD